MQLDVFRNLSAEEYSEILEAFEEDVVENIAETLHKVLGSYRYQKIDPGESFGKGPMAQFCNGVVREFIRKL